MRLSNHFLAAVLLATSWNVDANPPNNVPPACASTTPAGESKSVHETVCNQPDWSAVPACGTPGQTVAFQGAALKNNENQCVRVNICHGTASATNPFTTITVDRDGLNGHANADHSDRTQKDKVDYFPSTSIKNPNGAGNGDLDEDCVFIPHTTTTTTTTTSPMVFDDPHFLTWNNTYYDFMGACDLKLISAPSFAPEDGLALEIDIRTTARYEYSYIESAAIQIGEDVLEVSSFGGYMLGGVSAAELPNTIAGFTVQHSQPSANIHLFEILLDEDKDEKIVIKTFKDMVSVKLHGASPSRFHGSQGMLGNYDKNGLMMARDGVTVINDPNAFADEWQIKDVEPKLFQSRRRPQHPQACRLPSETKEKRRRLGSSSITMEEAEAACGSWPADLIPGCVHDVIALDDLELAHAGAF